MWTGVDGVCVRCGWRQYCRTTYELIAQGSWHPDCRRPNTKDEVWTCRASSMELRFQFYLHVLVV